LLSSQHPALAPRIRGAAREETFPDLAPPIVSVLTATPVIGFRAGIEPSPWFAFETSFYVGSGSKGTLSRQNGTFAATQLLHVRTGRLGTSPFFRMGVKVGPYVDGDLFGDRTDPVYDQAYPAGYPDRTDRIRMFRFAATFLPYVQMSDRLSLELGYLQKIFGYDTPATQLYTATVRYVF